MKYTSKEKYRLWTFQSLKSLDELEQKGILEVNWDRYSLRDPHLSAYKWLASLMKEMGILEKDNAPVWAWHSCGGYEKKPSKRDAIELLSEIEIENGIITIEFECPKEKALLSNYGTWNEIIHQFIDGKSESDIEREFREELLSIKSQELEAHESIQATMPYLRKDWIIEMRDL